MLTFTRRTDEAGSAALEFVILTPVLTLLVLFLLWAGGTGHARLAADLAAEEAATAAALCCDASDEDRRERVVEAILSGKPELSRLCVTEPHPLEDRYVSQSTFRLTTADGVTGGGVGVLTVGFGCETDGGVGGPGTIFPSVEIRGRASEAVLLPPDDTLDAHTRPTLTVADASTSEGFNSLTFVLDLDRPVAPGREISVFYRLLPFDAEDPDSIVNARPATTGDVPFDFCNASIDEILAGGGDYVPDDYAESHRDHLKTTGRVLISRGEARATISVPILDDCLYEDSERFRLELYNENDADVLIERRQAAGTILDDDAQPYVGFLLTEIDVPETPQLLALSRALPLELTLRNASDPYPRTIGVLPVTGNAITRDGTASAEEVGLCPPDYTKIELGGPYSPFPNTQNAGGNTVQVEILDDDIHEGKELFNVQLESAMGAQVGIDHIAEITIDDDDDPPTLAVFDSTDQVVTTLLIQEGAVGLQLRVRLVDTSGSEIGSGLPVTFTYETNDGAAKKGDDYVENIPPPGWTIEACESGSDLDTAPSVTIVDDNIVEGPQKFELVLRSAEPDNANDSATITVTIDDND